MTWLRQDHENPFSPARGEIVQRLPRLFFLLLDQWFYGGVERFGLGARIALRQRPRRGGASGEKEKQNQGGTAEHGAAAIAQRVRREKGGFPPSPGKRCETKRDPACFSLERFSFQQHH
jgi:hypothetical protein